MGQTDENFSKYRFPQPKLGSRPETIGGGWIVVARTKDTKRLRPSPWPFEYATLAEAMEGVHRLKKKHPDRTFAILQVVGEK